MRDEGLLESALARPQQLYAYGDPAPDLADLAASLAHDIARNHPFVDGNKRTAIVVCETFIEMNSATFEASDAEIFPKLLALAEGKLKLEDFAVWLRGHIHTSSGKLSVQEPRGNIRRRSAPGDSSQQLGQSPSFWWPSATRPSEPES